MENTFLHGSALFVLFYFCFITYSTCHCILLELSFLIGCMIINNLGKDAMLLWSQILTHAICVQTTDIARLRRAVAHRGLLWWNEPIVKNIVSIFNISIFISFSRNMSQWHLGIFLDFIFLMCSDLERRGRAVASEVYPEDCGWHLQEAHIHLWICRGDRRSQCFWLWTPEMLWPCLATPLSRHSIQIENLLFPAMH